MKNRKPKKEQKQDSDWTDKKVKIANSLKTTFISAF